MIKQWQLIKLIHISSDYYMINIIVKPMRYNSKIQLKIIFYIMMSIVLKAEFISRILLPAGIAKNIIQVFVHNFVKNSLILKCLWKNYYLTYFLLSNLNIYHARLAKFIRLHSLSWVCLNDESRY